MVKNAHYLILSNSSFAWFPAWLSTTLKYAIAPKYWARHNVSDGYWCLGYNLTTGWMYQDRNGKLQDYDSCKKEHDQFVAKNKELYSEANSTKHFKPSWKHKLKEKRRVFRTLRGEAGFIHALNAMTDMSLRRTIVRWKKLKNRIMLG